MEFSTAPKFYMLSKSESVRLSVKIHWRESRRLSFKLWVYGDDQKHVMSWVVFTRMESNRKTGGGGNCDLEFLNRGLKARSRSLLFAALGSFYSRKMRKTDGRVAPCGSQCFAEHPPPALLTSLRTSIRNKKTTRTHCSPSPPPSMGIVEDMFGQIAKWELSRTFDLLSHATWMRFCAVFPPL